jgi:MerR family transcriptional regulator, repressor of the yfmOP operon
VSTETHSLRIGDVAKLAGTTPRTIRYYEEIGLLPQAPSRPSGGHRVYTDAEVERLREVMRLKELLGVTLEELKTLLAAEESRATVRAQLRRDDVPPPRRRELLVEAFGHIDRQLELVEHRAGELAKLKSELSESRKRVRRKIRELETLAETRTDQEDTRSARIPESASAEGACLPASVEGAFPPAPPESTPEPAR